MLFNQESISTSSKYMAHLSFLTKYTSSHHEDPVYESLMFPPFYSGKKENLQTMHPEGRIIVARLLLKHTTPFGSLFSQFYQSPLFP